MTKRCPNWYRLAMTVAAIRGATSQRIGERPTRMEVMLQIASGKLFTREPAQSNELRGVAYTNLQLYGREPIETAAGRLLPTSNLGDSRTAVYELTELIEDPPVPGAIASHGVDPYLSDFAAIVSFALNVNWPPSPKLLSKRVDQRSEGGWGKGTERRS